MMQVGIFAKTFSRPNFNANLDAVAESGAMVTQYNMVCAGLPTLPDSLSPELCGAIRDAHVSRGLEMAAISATFNIIDPFPTRRNYNLKRFETLAYAAPALGTSVLTLCTGTRDPNDMWRDHPDNRTRAAWNDMTAAIERIVLIAESAGVVVAIEPEPSNVVNNASAARRLLDEIASPRLKIVFDGANLLDGNDPHIVRSSLAESLELLGQDIVIAHAKDVRWNSEPQYVPAGMGSMDYPFYLQGLVEVQFSGPLILHGLDECDVPRCIGYLERQLADIAPSDRSQIQSTRVK